MKEIMPRLTAIAQGKTKYYTGKPCKHGHVAERHVQNWTCVVCHAEKMVAVQRNWRAKNPEKIAGYTAKYAKAHAEYNKSWRAVNSEKVIEQARAWRQANADKCNEFSRKWRAKNRFHMNSLKAKRRADILQRTPLWLTEDDHWLINEIYELAALRNKVTGIDWHVDHIIPLRGRKVSGLHVPSNLQVIPASMNLRKGNKHAV
jgi:hypothetical protein